MIYFIAFLGFTGVALGAVGAHLLQGVLTVAQLGTFQTAVNYHQLYTVILLGLELARKHKALFSWIRLHTCIVFLIGVTLFSGSLYMYLATGITFFVKLTPIGGMCLMGGWVLLGGAYLKR